MLGDNLVLAIQNLGVIEARIFALDAFVGGVDEVLPKVGGMEQRFGRDAAHVQARAAELGIFFDDGGLQAVLAGAHRRGVATRAAPNHNQVISHFIFRITFEGRRTSARSDLALNGAPAAAECGDDGAADIGEVSVGQRRALRAGFDGTDQRTHEPSQRVQLFTE